MFKLFRSLSFKNEAVCPVTPIRQRRLRLEPLEERQMLSVNPVPNDVWAEVTAEYSDLNWSDIGDYNYIEITAENLTEANLRAAIAEAGTTEENDIIVVRTTQTQNKITLGGMELRVNINPTQFGSVMIVSLGDEKLTIDANQKSRVMEILGSSEVGLGGIITTNARISAVTGTQGIVNYGTITVTECIVTENSSDGILNSGTLTVTNSTISKNGTSGIYNNGGTATITNCLIDDNGISSSGTAGGLRNAYGTVIVTYSTFSGNTSGSGGAITNSGTTSTMTVSHCLILGNTARSLGGGIYNAGTLTLTDSVVSKNSNDSGQGGGIQNSHILKMANCTVLGNIARNGGGIYTSAGGEMALANCEISGNFAGTSYGGIYSAGQITLTVCTILGNSAGQYYGGIYYSGSSDRMTLTNCLVAGNTSPNSTILTIADGIHIDTILVTVTLTNCTISGNTGGIFTAASNTDLSTGLTLNNTIVVENTLYDIAKNTTSVPVTGTNNLTTFANLIDGSANLGYNPSKPLFVDTTNGDYRLAPNSQAINRGSNDAAIAAGLVYAPTTRDLAGNRRYVGVSVDIGAYEFDASLFAGDLVVTTLSDGLPGVEYPGDLSLREALLLAKPGNVITFDATMFRNGDGDMIAKTITLAPEFGELKITNSVSIVGITRAAEDIEDADIALLTIDADKKSRVLSVTTKTGELDVVLENLTLTGGDASDDGVSQGGAMYVRNANLALFNVAFEDNTASYGGAVFLMNGVNNVVTMTGVTMSDNIGDWGGAIYQAGGALTMDNGKFLENNGRRGGAIYQAGGELSLDAVKLIENQSTWGGGLFQASGTATLTQNTVLRDNAARNKFGGVLYKMKDAEFTVVNTKTDEILRHLDDALAQYLDDADWDVEGA